MLLKFKEQVVGDFLIPAFTLSKGELVIIQIPNTTSTPPLEFLLADILTGKIQNNETEIHAFLKFAEYPKEGWFRFHFVPQTVQEYITQNSGPDKETALRIYDMKDVGPKNRVQELAWFYKRLLSIFTTLSCTKNLVFSLVGLSPNSGVEIYNLVKKEVETGGAAILIDNFFEEFKNDCTTFITAKYLSE